MQITRDVSALFAVADNDVPSLYLAASSAPHQYRGFKPGMVTDLIASENESLFRRGAARSLASRVCGRGLLVARGCGLLAFVTAYVILRAR